LPPSWLNRSGWYQEWQYKKQCQPAENDKLLDPAAFFATTGVVSIGGGGHRRLLKFAEHILSPAHLKE
jgi:hypothetical protein